MNEVLTLANLKTATTAFDGFVTVQDSSLPDYYKGIFPKVCDCGGEIILTEDDSETYGFTQLQCCNPDCYVKMAYRFSYFAKSLGFNGFGEATSKNLYRELQAKLQYPTFLSIFLLDDALIRHVNGDAYANSFAEMKHKLFSNAYQFKDVVSALGIPGVGKSCKIFNIIKEPIYLVDAVLNNRLDELCDVVGIKAERTRFYLSLSLADILILFKEITPKVLATPKKEIFVAITGNVTLDNESLTRSEFMWKCEALRDSSGDQAFKLVETKAASKLNYVIADAPSNSSKYRLGVQLGNLITAQNFYDMLKNEIGGDEVVEQK